MKKLLKFVNFWTISIVLLCITIFFLSWNPVFIVEKLIIMVAIVFILFFCAAATDPVNNTPVSDYSPVAKYKTLTLLALLSFVVTSLFMPGYSPDMIIVLRNGNKVLAKPDFVMLRQFKIVPSSISINVDILYFSNFEKETFLNQIKGQLPKTKFFSRSIHCLPNTTDIYEKYEIMKELIPIEHIVKNELRRIALEREKDKQWNGPKQIPIPDNSILKKHRVILAITE